MSAPSSNSDSATVDASAGSDSPGSVSVDEQHVQPYHISRDVGSDSATAASTDSAEAEPTRPPPIARLYRHALESILAFLTPDEMMIALHICRDWLAAVRSMGSRDWWEPDPSSSATPMAVIVQSAMARHMSSMGAAETRVELNVDTLFILARHMAHVDELVCRLSLPPPPLTMGPRQFPVKLRTLDLTIAAPATVTSVNETLQAIGNLLLLEELALALPVDSPRVSFAPLSALPALCDFELSWRLEACEPKDADADPDPFELSDAQVQQLRAMQSLAKFEIHPMSTSLLQRLLASPHELQWQQIKLPDPLDDEAAALLPQLPSLTFLSAVPTCTHFDFFKQLTNLRQVDLLVMGPDEEGRSDSLVAGLQHCSQIEGLYLSMYELTSAQLTGLMPHLPLLEELELADAEIDSLAFLSAERLQRQLISLRLHRCAALPLAELRHVDTLKGLEQLILNQSFTGPIDAATVALYTPPSSVLPHLESFVYKKP